MSTDFRPHSSHWGTFRARYNGALEVRPFEQDPAPSDLLHNLPSAPRHASRLTQPLIRRGWLEDGPGPDRRRGSDDYVEVEWDRALDITAKELRRLGAGPDLPDEVPLPGAKVFGGSYGWSSAGRFHHAQSQVHRFLNSAFGGYVAHVDTYSSGAGAVILDLVWGNTLKMSRQTPYWTEIADETELLLAFGGIPIRNLAASPGGNSQHIAGPSLQKAADRGCSFVSVSPIADDFADMPGVTRLVPRPGTDVAVMLGMAYVLHSEGLADRAYLDRYTTGYDRFAAYLEGQTDGQPKTPEWAEAISNVPADRIADTARLATRKRTHVAVSYALQRAKNGEQPIWMGLTLAAMLGQYPLRGGGFSYSLASIGNTGKPPLAVPSPTLPQGMNRVGDFIPVARISELLLKPGQPYRYKLQTRRYADIRLVYWAGGNPFHHHQDLTRLREAFWQPDTIIVHDSVGTATTQHADIIFPATISLERDDIGAAGNDPFLVPMPQIVPPLEGARDDYDIFAALAARIGVSDHYTEGRGSLDWQVQMYERTRAALEARGDPAPNFDNFLAGDILDLPTSDLPPRIDLFHADPVANPLDTPSGRIEIFSQRIAEAGFVGHPAWLPHEEWLGADRAKDYPFQLIANQPRGRLHSQLDFGATSMSHKQAGREVLRLNPVDAKALGIVDGDIVRVFNDRGGFLAAAAPDDAMPRNVAQIPTGAWYAPIDLPGVGVTCVNGNPNVVTCDDGASDISQGCAGQLTLIRVEKWSGPVPSVVPHAEILRRKPANGTEQ